MPSVAPVYPEGLSCTQQRYRNSDNYYCLERDDGSKEWLVRVSRVLDILDSKLEGWHIFKLVEAIEEQLVDGARYSAEDVRGLAHRNRFAYQAYTKQSQKVGTQVHKMVEHVLIGKKIPAMPSSFDREMACEAENSFRLWEQWWGENSSLYDVVLTESVVWSEELGTAGTLDIMLRGKVSGDLFNVDLKTGKQITAKNLLQQGAYSDMCRKTLGVEVQGACVLRVGKHDLAPHPVWISKDQLNAMEDGWRALAEAYVALEAAKRIVNKSKRDHEAVIEEMLF